MNKYRLKLFVFGDSANGRVARSNVDRLCQTVDGGCDIEVIDVRSAPEEAEAARVLATPLLLLIDPGPVRRVIGDLSDLARVMSFLGLPAKAGLTVS